MMATLVMGITAARSMPPLLVAASAAPRSSRELSSAPAGRPAAPPLAKDLGDVFVTTFQSFASVGAIGFLWRIRKGRVVASQAALNWGKLSAGFSGGRALGQVISGRDGTFAAVFGSLIGGIAAANSVAQIPSSVATFVGFTLVIEYMGMQAATAQPAPSGGSKRQESVEKARREYTRRHKDDPTRLKALSAPGVERNIFGERVVETVRPNSQLQQLGQRLSEQIKL